MGPMEQLLRDLAQDPDLLDRWLEDPYAVGEEYGLSKTAVDLLLDGCKAGIDLALEKEGSSGMFVPWGLIHG